MCTMTGSAGLGAPAARPGCARGAALTWAATAIAGSLAVPAAAAQVSAAPRAHPGRAAGAPSPAEPVIVHIRDLRSGEMDVFAGEATARLRDPGLAARLVHAVG